MHTAPIHQHRRKRADKELEPYPHPENKFRFLDRIVDIVSLVYPLTILPQIYEVWIKHNAGGVSLLMWSLFLLFTIPLVTYAYAHKEKRLSIMYTIFLFMHATMVIGLLLFG